MPQTVAKKTPGNSDKQKRRTNSKRSAVKNIPVSSSAKLLKTAEIKVSRAQAALEKATARVATTREKAQVAAEKAKKNGRVPSINAAKRAKEIAEQARSQRQDAAAALKSARESLRDAKQKVKLEEQKQRMIERKETAKQKAVAAFIKKWEREWDKKLKKDTKPARSNRRPVSGKPVVKPPMTSEITHDSAFASAAGHGK